METVIRRTSRKDQKIATKSVFDLTRTAASISRRKPDVVKIKIQESGEFVSVPRKALDLLFNILSNMAEGKSISLVPSDSEVSTQQAADMLNVSRPHIVKLLEQGVIPFKKAGSHRRILLEDLLKYDAKLNEQKNNSLKILAKQAQELKLGYESVNEPIVDKNIKSYANAPFFVKKAKGTKALIDKYGVPERTSK